LREMKGKGVQYTDLNKNIEGAKRKTVRKKPRAMQGPGALRITADASSNIMTFIQARKSRAEYTLLKPSVVRSDAQ
jgi:hypothetical protein